MKAKEFKVKNILTEDMKYLIPPYQRPYSWSKDHAEQLIDDIFCSYKADEKEYFIGSMICINDDDSDVYEVVDGQQRLTTLSIIMSQLKKLIKHQGVKDDLQKRILPIDPYSDEPSEARLIIRKKENSLYSQYILQGKLDYKPENPTNTEIVFLDNDKVIHEYLKDMNEETLKDLAQYILQNVYIVFVKTDSFASSFRLFNVLNNRGLPLSSADLLKNALFEAADGNKKHSKQVDQAWDEVESMVGRDKLDKFLTIHRLSEKKDRDRVIKKGFNSFLNSLKNDFDNDAVKMSLVLRNSAKNYIRIIENDFKDLKLKRIIASLLQLQSDEWIPALMGFLNRINRDESLDWNDFSHFVKIFEKVYMHGWMGKLIKSKREMVCYSALVAINNDLSIDEIIDYTKKHENNELFIKSLNENLYEPRGNQINLVKTILLRLDLEQQDESVLKVYTGRITIEHILPQKITNSYWLERFDSEQHKEWLHKIGNLTLISGSKNSEAQNSDFIKKKKIYEKLNNKSSFDITRDLCHLNDWSFSELTERHNKMCKSLEKIWLV